jgi:hypothetical protein
MLRGDRLHIHNSVKYSSDVQCKKDISTEPKRCLFTALRVGLNRSHSSLHDQCWRLWFTFRGFVPLQSCIKSTTRTLIYESGHAHISQLQIRTCPYLAASNQDMPISHSFKSVHAYISQLQIRTCPYLTASNQDMPISHSFKSVHAHISQLQITATLVQSQDSPCGTATGQNGSGEGFLSVLQFLLTMSLLTTLNIHIFKLTNCATHANGKNNTSWTRSKEFKSELFMLRMLMCADLSDKTSRGRQSQRWKDSITRSCRHM